jgi:hypothetical protein
MEQLLTEQDFLHDIASPIGLALMTIEVILENLQSIQSTPPEDLKQMETTLQALLRASELIAERRQVLIDQKRK